MSPSVLPMPSEIQASYAQADSVALSKAGDQNKILFMLNESDVAMSRRQLGNVRISVLRQMEERQLIVGNIAYVGADKTYVLTAEGLQLATLKSSESYRSSVWNLMHMLHGDSYGKSRKALGGPSLFQLDDMLNDGFLVVTQEKRPAVKEKVNVYRLTQWGAYIRSQAKRRRIIEIFHFLKTANDEVVSQRVSPERTGDKDKLSPAPAKKKYVVDLHKRTDWRNTHVRRFKLHEIGVRTRTAGWANADELRPLLVADPELSLQDIEEILALEFPVRAFSLEDYLLQLPRNAKQWTLQQRYHVLCWKMDRYDMWQRQRLYQAMEDSLHNV